MWAWRETGEPRDGFTADLETYPQVMINVPIARGFKLEAAPQVGDVVAETEAALNGSGRIVLRPSGTEPLIRVMVEGRDATQVRRAAETIADAVRAAASGG